MHDRAAQVQELLSGREVGFVIVTSPDPRAIDEAIVFHDRLVQTGLTPGAFIINRVHPVVLETGQEQLSQWLTSVAGVAPDAAPRLARVLAESHSQIQALALADAQEIERLKRHCGPGLPYVEVPLFDEDVHDIGGLLRLAGYLE
jgi:anion-transporting  ArsA/GET3 family ATPase